MARRKFEPGRNGESRIVEIPSSTNGVCENKLFYAHRLKELRTIAHLTQADLADPQLNKAFEVMQEKLEKKNSDAEAA